MEGTSSVTKIPLEAFAGQCQRSLQEIHERISYYSSLPLEPDQVRQYLNEPIAAIPKTLLEHLPPLRLVLVPYLEKGPNGSNDLVCFERPQARSLTSSVFDVGDALFLFLAAEQQEVADFHYWFYHGVAELESERIEPEVYHRYQGLILDEMNRMARGEVDERSYELKHKMARRAGKPASETKAMRQYVNQSLADTLTLYLHGLCCDIDVEPGPRQLASRYVRRRLELLAEVFPPNPGYVLFPANPESRNGNAS